MSLRITKILIKALMDELEMFTGCSDWSRVHEHGFKCLTPVR